MAENLLVVIDSSAASGDLVYQGGSNGKWTTKSGAQWYGNSSAWSGSTSASFHVTFTGNAIAFYGDSPPLRYSQEMRVTIDGQESFKTDFSADRAGSYCQWWQSPTLDHGMHTISLEGLTQTSLDFAVVTVDRTLVKSEQQIIVDDDDNASIVYNGDWVHNPGPFTSNEAEGMPIWFPFHNATHQSHTVGSSASFNFTGSHIDVYGLLSVEGNGSITARYTLDSNVTRTKYEWVENPSQRNVMTRPSLLFNISLRAGNHTLLIDIEDVQNMTYSLDYMVYTHSVHPLLHPQSVTRSFPPTSSSSAVPTRSISLTMTTAISSSFSPSSSSLSMHVTTEMPTTSSSHSSLPLTSTSEFQNTTTANTEPTVAAGSIKGNARAGEIVGVALGSTVILAVLIAGILYYRRRRNRLRRFVLLQDSGSSSSFGKSVGSRSTPIEPFTLSHPSPGSRAAIDTLDLKGSNLLVLNRNPDLIQLSMLHRRSGSGPRSGAASSAEDSHYAMSASSSTILVDGKSSYKFF